MSESLVSPYEPTAKMIATLAAARGGAQAMWTWLGPIPWGRHTYPPEIAIALHLGLRPHERDFDTDDLRPTAPDTAKAVLAFVATNSMAYPMVKTPDQAVLEAIECGFAPFGSDLRCYSNGEWRLTPEGVASNGWMPLTAATFDSGIIGHNGKVGFAFWVDEED